MNDMVKSSIDARKGAFSTAYELNDKMTKEIDALFEKIYKIGEECSDAMDFETKFASSPLNKEYTDLFAKVASECKPKVMSDDYVSDPRTKGEKVLDEVSSDAKLLVEDLTMPARRKARQEMDDKLHDTPYGQVEQISNMFHLFKKIKKKKPEENIPEDENN